MCCYGVGMFAFLMSAIITSRFKLYLLTLELCQVAKETPRTFKHKNYC